MDKHPAPPPYLGEDPWIRYLYTITGEHLSDPEFNVDRLARLMKMGRTTLYRSVRQKLGVSVNRFILELRLQRTVEFLENKEVRTVRELAEKVGLRDVGHFTRTFRRRFGRSPAAW